MSPEKAARMLLEAGMTTLQRRLEETRIRSLSADFDRWRRPDMTLHQTDLRMRLLAFLGDRVRRERERISGLTERLTRFTQQMSVAADVREQAVHILEFARELGANSRQLRGDRRAFARWFGPDAVIERCRRQITDGEGALSFFLDRFGELSASAIGAIGSEKAIMEAWQQIGIESTVEPLLAFTGDARVRIAAFRCLATALRVMPEGARRSAVTESTLQFVYRASLDRRQHVWIQCEALRLLENLSAESLGKALFQRLEKPSEGDDLFVRRAAVQVLGKNLDRFPDAHALLRQVESDPSPFVRQGMVKALRHADDGTFQTWIRHYARADASPQVRAMAVLEMVSATFGFERLPFVQEILTEVLAEEQDEFVIRASLQAACDGLDIALRFADRARPWYDAMMARISALHCDAPRIPVRRWAAGARERLWCGWDETARMLRADLARHIAGWAPGRPHAFPRRFLRRTDSEILGRVLSVLAQNDYGLYVQRTLFGGRIIRGHRFGFRFWRWCHEFLHPSPDKRQAYRHTIGRHFSGTIRAPSAIMSELTSTKVPGEPLYMAPESGWRPYLPLVDEVLSPLLEIRLRPTPIRIFTSEGITEMRMPGCLIKRLRTWFHITRRFAHFARLRNWDAGMGMEPNAYAAALRDLGVEISFRPYAGRGDPDPEVIRFFEVIREA